MVKRPKNKWSKDPKYQEGTKPSKLNQNSQISAKPFSSFKTKEVFEKYYCWSRLIFPGKKTLQNLTQQVNINGQKIIKTSGQKTQKQVVEGPKITGRHKIFQVKPEQSTRSKNKTFGFFSAFFLVSHLKCI